MAVRSLLPPLSVAAGSVVARRPVVKGLQKAYYPRLRCGGLRSSRRSRSRSAWGSALARFGGVAPTRVRWRRFSPTTSCALASSSCLDALQPMTQLLLHRRTCSLSTKRDPARLAAARTPPTTGARRLSSSARSAGSGSPVAPPAFWRSGAGVCRRVRSCDFPRPSHRPTTRIADRDPIGSRLRRGFRCRCITTEVVPGSVS